MKIALGSVIRRYMEGTGRYFEPRDDRPCPVRDRIVSEEALLGWYENPEPWEHCFIVFTDRALYGVHGGEIVRVGLSELAPAQKPDKRADLTGIRVRTRDGFRFLRIAGSHRPSGKYSAALDRIGLGDVLFADAWKLLQVLSILAVHCTLPDGGPA